MRLRQAQLQSKKIIMNQELLYFEDLTVGRKWKSQSRTITETDIVMFAGLSGDYNPLHTDEEFAKKEMFGQRIAHGLLGLSIASGLPSPEPPSAVIAFMGLEWKFKKPIFIGDTVHFECDVKNRRELKGGERGIVMVERKLVNQKEEVTQEGTFTLLIRQKEK